jgi:hypothetical protein
VWEGGCKSIGVAEETFNRRKEEGLFGSEYADAEKLRQIQDGTTTTFPILHKNEPSTCCAYESIQVPKLPEHGDSSEECSELPIVGTGGVSHEHFVVSPKTSTDSFRLKPDLFELT